jgi:hypothetical protein
MKILCINTKIDKKYFESKGLFFDVENVSLPNEKYNMIFTAQKKNSLGQTVDLYTPDVKDILEARYKNSKYDAILVGWNPKDYGDQLKNTGGFTFKTPLSNGAYVCTIRVDGNELNYSSHELMHFLCDLVNFNYAFHSPVDFMDFTLVGNEWKSFYKNDYLLNDADSNFNQTWKAISPFLDRLNGKTTNSIVTLKRFRDDGVQSLGDLTIGSFSCKTLERPWKDNKSNISCIPKGTYQVKWTFSPRLFKSTYEVQNVPGRSGIRWHKGNYFFNVDGCILLGTEYGDLNHDKWADILNSEITIKKFEDFMERKEFTLVIK